MTTSVDYDLIRPDAREALRLRDGECDAPERGVALGVLLGLAIWLGVAIGVFATLVVQHVR